MTTRAILLFGLLILAECGQKAQANENPDVKAKAEFKKLILQRKQVSAKLEKVDEKALASVKSGDNVAQLHAEQTSLQDRLDLIQLRLETLSARYGYAVPELTKRQADEEKDPQGRPMSSAFDRGRTRTMEQLRLQTLRFLATLDLSQLKTKVNGGK